VHALAPWHRQGGKQRLADLFLGLTSPDRVYAYSDQAVDVFVSHA